ncbi:hypothetical protein GDO78_015721 [Eleutherodactylus coqui]|uniref:Uncharacterized protein n=1 Tax=Eleutherodactylus coqui TaxID=57060 RepID=A0A8J6EDD5_ELECQ|nr:hypothetical protein GDO78_015721 [Eleutherodactylus coqui]
MLQLLRDPQIPRTSGRGRPTPERYKAEPSTWTERRHPGGLQTPQAPGPAISTSSAGDRKQSTHVGKQQSSPCATRGAAD